MLLRTHQKFTAAALVLSLGLTGCTQADEHEVGGAVLAGGGAFAICMLAKGNPAVCAVIAGVAAVAGGLIGQKIDERDAKIRQDAVDAALNNQDMWVDSESAAPVSSSDTSAKQTSPPPPPVVNSESAASAAPTVSASDATAAPTWKNPDSADAQTWHNPDTGNSGEIAPVRTYADPVSGDLCHEYVETYTRNGTNYSQPTKSCKQPGGTWSITYVLSSGD